MKSRVFLIFFIPIAMLMMSSCAERPVGTEQFTGQPGEVQLMTLNPGHFHAALVQKTMMEQVSPVVHIYSPGGTDLELHQQRIDGFNTRADDPTNWQSVVYTGPEYLERMLSERPGNVVVLAGNNRLKTEYIKRSVDAGLHVLSDKPMAIDTEGFELLREAFRSAEANGVLLYDIMTERSEITTTLQRELSQMPELFGELLAGSPEEPSIVKESVHYLFKYVSGSPLRRPDWYFDVNQQGEGIVDVTTHLVDLSMWGAFPGQIVDYRTDVNLLEARRWPTMVTREQYERVTAVPEFPEYLRGQLDADGVLPLFSNGDMLYTLNGIHTKISVIWGYEAPPGGGDTHFSVMRGSRANVFIRQGAEQNFKASLYVEPAAGVTEETLEPALRTAVSNLQASYPGLELQKVDAGWEIVVPDRYYAGHEAHFGEVAQRFFRYLVEGRLPEWEVPNMITKYYITSQAREMAMASGTHATHDH